MIDYTNHAGVRAMREIVPHALRFGSTEWHPEPQWLLDAHDVAKDDVRTFAMKDIHFWHPDPRQVRVDAAISKQLQASIERNARMVTRLKVVLDRCNNHQPTYETHDAAADLQAILNDREP